MRPTPKREPNSSPPPADRKGPAPIAGDLSLPAFDDGTSASDPGIEAKRQAETLVARGDFDAAWQLLSQHRDSDPSFVLFAASMGRLAEGLIRQQQTESAIAVLTLGCNAYPVYEPRWRIRIATLELSVNQDPIAAIKQLQMIDKEMLDTSMRHQYLKVAQHARRMAGR